MLNFFHPLPDVEILAGRQGFLLAACTDRTVLHVGCVDTGLLDERFAAGELLHERLATTARELWGTDVDADGLRFLEDRGIRRLFRVDLSSEEPPAALAAVAFDVILLAEVLEHVPNPGKMLRALRRRMTPGRTRLIVTVPNAFSLAGLLSVARGIEHVHPDHNYYFSRTTLARLFEKSGLRLLKEYVYLFDVDRLPARRLQRTLAFGERGQTETRPLRSSLRRLAGRLRHLPIGAAPGEVGRTLLAGILYRRTSYWADGIVAICARDDDGSSTA